MGGGHAKPLPIYAGFSSPQVAINYQGRRDAVTKEVLECPTAVFTVTVEQARYTTEPDIVPA